ncbi:MAG: STAS/SEC14 domain-containing protein [Stenomitos frigidus ULC029]
MSLDELLNAAKQLNEADLDTLVNRLLLLHASRKAPILLSQEASLLLQINQGIPTGLYQHYHRLTEKRDAETLTPAEYEEVLHLSDRIELLTAQRAEALVKLSTLRQVPLLQLMNDLGIQSPTYA